ncbi:MAG: carboxylating nicotinate-nucleotide diphosphorylase [Dehalococcoidia bacterium]|nr:carboxylating nicotinate-nucleotide diphosphorylase [Dehalococcoidia bacterium]
MKTSDELLQKREVQAIIRLALAEDRFRSDATGRLVIPAHLESQAVLLSKADGVLSGIGVFATVFQRVDPSLKVDVRKTDGSKLKAGDKVAVVSGNTRSVLRAERTALNFVCHLSAVASATAVYVECIKGTKAQIADTRKTSAGQRLLEKYAVSCGGGKNHRMHLSDAILIKDNHIAALRNAGQSLGEIVSQAKKRNRRGLEIEVEVNSLSQAEEAVSSGADIVLLDNMSVDEMQAVVSKHRGRVRFEASGGITLQNLREVAETGVHIISIGALTHSVKVFDFSLEMM